MKHSILIVDSQREFIRALQKALESLQHALIITGVLSGEEGLLEARLNPVDLLITNESLPGMPGSELVTAIRSVRPDVKTVYLSGQASASKPAVSVDAHFSRTIPINEFLKTIAALLDIETSPAPPRPVKNIEPPMSEDESVRFISVRMADLRNEINADSVTLVNDSGKVLIRAGGLRDSEFEKNVIPSLMSAFSAGLKVSHYLGRSQQRNIYFYQGEEYDLVMSSISSSYALVVATQGVISRTKTNEIHSIINTAQEDIASLLKKMGISLAPEIDRFDPPFPIAFQEESRPDFVEMDNNLEALLDEDAKPNLQNANEFWDLEEEPSGTGTISGDSLTYEQAVQLGLFEKDKKFEE